MNYAYHGSRTPTPELVLDIINRSSGVVGVDVETVSLDDRTPLGISFATSSEDSFYFPMDSPLVPWDVLKNPNVLKIFHNGHFDLGVIKDSKGVEVRNVADTIVAAQLLGLPPSLFDLYLLFFGEQLTTIEELLGKKGKNQLTMAQIPEEKVAEKCCKDSKATLKVWLRVQPEIPKEAFSLEMRLLPVLMAMEKRGIRVDVEQLKRHRVRVKREVDYYKGIANGLGFNPGSSVQAAAVLMSRGWRIFYNKKTKNPILHEEILSTYYADDPIAQMVLLYRKAKTLLSTFIEPVLNRHLQGDRIFGRIHQDVTNSGRLSTTKPNRQNIPEAMRDIYIPSEGCIFEDWDLSQIELRVLAYRVWQTMGDKKMQTLFEQGGSNADFHADTARAMNCEKRIAKGVNFAIIYGGDEHTLQQRLGIALEHAANYIRQYFERFPGVKAYIIWSKERLYATGQAETRLGRRRLFPDVESDDQWKRAKAEREAFNHLIQGDAAEHLKELQVRIASEPQCNTVHDEILLDLPPEHIPDRDACVGLAPYATPMKVGRGVNWKDLIEVK